jgi:hypothetical protein
MIKILVRPREYGRKTNFTKTTLLGPSIGSYSQKWFFDLFSIVQSKKYFLHYKPCPITSLSSRKSWKIFALPIEKIEIFHFRIYHFRLKYLQMAICAQEAVIFFWILHSRINKSWLALFLFRPYFEKFLASKTNKCQKSVFFRFVCLSRVKFNRKSAILTFFRFWSQKFLKIRPKSKKCEPCI